MFNFVFLAVFLVVIFLQSSLSFSMSGLLELGPIVFGGTAGIIAYLQGRGVISPSRHYTSCNIAMDLRIHSDISDGHRWRFPDYYNVFL